MSDITDFLLERITEGAGQVWAEREAKRRIIERHAIKERLPPGAPPICSECGGSDWKPESPGVEFPFPWVMPWPCPTLRLLALPYDDHPDYREEWRNIP